MSSLAFINICLKEMECMKQTYFAKYMGLGKYIQCHKKYLHHYRSLLGCFWSLFNVADYPTLGGNHHQAFVIHANDSIFSLWSNWAHSSFAELFQFMLTGGFSKMTF